MYKKAIFIIAGIVLSLNCLTQAQDLIQISNTQTWSTFDQGGFGPNDTLQILAGGNLIITDRCSLDNGRHLIIEEGGRFTMNARLDTNSRGQITINGGEFHNTVDFKFPDSNGTQDVHIWLYGGLMICAQIESITDRGSMVHVGGGVLRVGNTSGMARFDPETTDWTIIPIPPYDSITIVDIGGGWKEVSATSPFAVTECWPENEATDVLRDVVLGWTPAEFASSHDVYLGTVFKDVNEADAGSPLLVGPGQDANSYDAGRLEFGQTYYWRIDEVNNANSASPWKGMVWSFTIEPLARPISAGDIIATASSQDPDQGPENTINESGLVDDLHSTQTTDMWATAESQALPAWIQYEFDKPYQLHEMLVWNYNGPSFLTALGLQNVTVEYSTDGVDWIINDNVSVFNQATGKNDYTANTTVPFGNVSVKFVKITATTNWSGNFLEQYGLSEVRFMYIPSSAREPEPEDGASGVDINAILDWQAGREADEHNIYISADEQAVIDGTVAPVTVAEAGYGPLSLDLGTTYYWRVDEVNNANVTPIWQGSTWSFTTSNYRIVDDFESYNDIPQGEEGSNLVYLTWIDGYDTPSTNGSTMGYTSGISLETTIVHGGKQSVPLMYNNTTAGISKVTANAGALPGDSDWTIGSPEQLVLWVYGSADNNSSTDRMYVEIGGVKKIFSGDIALEQWQDFPIDLASLGINLGNVGTVTIGLEKTGSAGGSGMVFIDDILLYRSL
ncbi:MAG: discoidin domain-containing protein [Sedimentisphaerales bacterium]|nr:discoidin domain-containing protein [Sedimentisphaerales bacterium]